ncbi:MAG TPA: hypothetical protein VMY37_14040 [Thermoguttaceae bacterium]|nr:hypothetical protein [Thermoguttaceae bacterium]
MGRRSADWASGPDSDGRFAEGWPGDLRSACSVILFRTSDSEGRWAGDSIASGFGTVGAFEAGPALGLAVSLDLGEDWSRSGSLLRTSESEGRSAGDLTESGLGVLVPVGPRGAVGPTPVLDGGEAADCARSRSLLRTSENAGRSLGRLTDSAVGAAELDGVWLASGFARSLDAGVARTLPSSLLRTSESEACPADGPTSNRFEDPRLADGVLASDRTLDPSNVGSVALVRFALGRVGVDRVTLGPLAAEGLERGASSVRRLVTGALRLGALKLGAVEGRREGLDDR